MDFEVTPVFNVTMRATDKELQFVERVVSIVLVNVDDPPSFLGAMRSLPENTAAGLLLGGPLLVYDQVWG